MRPVQWEGGGQRNRKQPDDEGRPEGPGAGAPKAGGHALPASPQRGRQGRGGGQGRTHRPPQQQRAREPRSGTLAARTEAHRKPAEARARSQKAPGPEAETSGPKGPRRPRGQEPTAPEAARADGAAIAGERSEGDPRREQPRRRPEARSRSGRAQGGPGGATRSAAGSPRRSKGDRSQSGGSPQRSEGEPKRSGASERPRSRTAAHTARAGEPGGRARGAAPATGAKRREGAERRTGAAKRRRARRAGATPRRGRGPGANAGRGVRKKGGTGPKPRHDQARIPKRVWGDEGNPRRDGCGPAPGAGPRAPARSPPQLRAQRRFAPMRQRSRMERTGSQPWVAMLAAAREPMRAANWRPSEQSGHAPPDEGASPARQPVRATGRPNGARARTGTHRKRARSASGSPPP